jgi:hypothetical protein
LEVCLRERFSRALAAVERVRVGAHAQQRLFGYLAYDLTGAHVDHPKDDLARRRIDNNTLSIVGLIAIARGVVAGGTGGVRGRHRLCTRQIRRNRLYDGRRRRTSCGGLLNAKGRRYGLDGLHANDRETIPANGSF